MLRFYTIFRPKKKTKNNSYYFHWTSIFDTNSYTFDSLSIQNMKTGYMISIEQISNFIWTNWWTKFNDNLYIFAIFYASPDLHHCVVTMKICGRFDCPERSLLSKFSRIDVDSYWKLNKYCHLRNWIRWTCCRFICDSA